MFSRKRKGIVGNVKDAVDQKRIQSLLSEGSKNEGALKLKQGVKIDGTQIGSVMVSDKSGVIWISETGHVQGDIEAPQIYIFGHYSGDLKAEKLIICGSAVINGRIFADEIVYRDMTGASIRAEFFGRKASKDVDTLPSELVPINNVFANTIKAA